MNTLIIDTSQSNITICLLIDKQVFKQPAVECNLNHSVVINSAVQKLLDSVNLSLKQIDNIAVVVGCGSFTGIRVGIAFAKAVHLVNNCKYIAVNSLQVAAYTNNSQVITSYIMSNKGYYAATYKGIEQLSPPYFTYQLEIGDNFVNVNSCDAYTDNLIEIVFKRIQAQQFDLQLIPIYVQLCQAQKELQQQQYSICKLSLSDIDDLAKLEKSCFGVEAWSKQMIMDMLNNVSTYICGIKTDNKVIAYGSMSIVIDEASINNVSVSIDYRNRGISKLLMTHMENYAKENNVKSIYLDVNEYNIPAINLYKKFGYKQIGKRRNYYSGELHCGCRDAIEMKKEL